METMKCKFPMVYLGLCQTSMMEQFYKKSDTIFFKNSFITDVWQDPKYVCGKKQG